MLRGYRRPPTLHDDRLRNAPVGHFFDVITNGFGAMPDYAAQIRAEDRWAIVGVYPRAAVERTRRAGGRAAGPAGSTSVTTLGENAGTAIPELGAASAEAARRGRHRRAGVARRARSLNVTQFLQSYLLAYMWCLGVTLGCLALGMVHQLSGGAWGVVIRRPIGAASRVLPVMTLLFLPIAVRHGTSL